MKKLIILIMFAGFSAPGVASANLTQEYYTWGGHDAVISAFQRSALIFGGSDYQSLFGTLATVSLAALVMRVMFGLLFGGFKGSPNVASQAILPWLLCVSIFIGTVIPKGTLHIYDPTENKYQAVGGIPDIIVFVAAATNKIERALVEQVATAGDPAGFELQAGGKGFLGLYTIAKAPLQAADSLLDQSLSNYITDCVAFETTLTSGYVKDLRKESTDLVTSLSKAVNPSVYTVLYNESLPPQGEGVSCTAAWANIQPRLMADSNLNNNLKTACSEMGFNAETPTELTDCKAKMSGIVGAQIMPGKTSMDFLRSAYVAQIMDTTLSGDSSGTAYANFSILNKASGTMSTVNSWLPTIRAVILAVTVALTPFLSLLILTPFMGRALKFVLGSFIFLTIWGVADAVLHQFIIDYSNKLYADVRQYSLGLDALRFFPSSTEKILALFGLVRASGLVLAGAITSGVLGLSGSVGAAIGGKIAGEVTASGAQGEQQILDPGAKASIRKSNQMSIPTETMANQNPWETRQIAEYSQLSGGLQQQLGAVEGASGLGSYEKTRHGQGVTSSYRSQGDNALNQEFVRQAENMGVPRAEAQKMAAATVNHGEGLAELRRLQVQGFTGQQASETYWQGKTVDHMQGKSVGQQDGFTMYRPVEGQDVGKWGQTSATWQDSQMVGLQGNSVNVATSDQIRTNYDKAYSSAITESFKADQSLGESVTQSWGNSGTWSQVNAAARQLYSATSGSVDVSKSVNSSVVSSLRDSKAIDERTGQTVDKSAWAQVTGGASTPQISPIKASIEGGASWRVTTSDGKSYAVHQSAEEAKSLQRTVGQSWRTTTSDVRSGQYSSTAQAALSQVESIMGNRTAAETAMVSYQRADEFRENQGQSHAKAADMSASLARDFYHYVGEQQFGGGARGDREAIRHIEGLAATGKTAEIGKLKDQYFAERNINPETLGAEMPKLKGPDMSKSPDSESIMAKIETGKTNVDTVLTTQPNIKATDPTAKVGKRLETNSGVVDHKEIKAEMAETQKAVKSGKISIEAKGVEIKKTPVEKLHSIADEAGKRSGEKAAEFIRGVGETVPGKIVGGLVNAVPKIMDGLGQLNEVGQGTLPPAIKTPLAEPVKLEAMSEVQPVSEPKPQPVMPHPAAIAAETATPVVEATSPVQPAIKTSLAEPVKSEAMPEVKSASEPKSKPVMLHPAASATEAVAPVTPVTEATPPVQPAITTFRAEPVKPEVMPEVMPTSEPKPQTQKSKKANENIAQEITQQTIIQGKEKSAQKPEISPRRGSMQNQQVQPAETSPKLPKGEI